MYRPTLVIMLVLGFLIAYQVVNPYQRKFAISGRLELVLLDTVSLEMFETSTPFVSG